MSKQSGRTPGTVTDEEIIELCQIAKIPEAGRSMFADDFREVVAQAVRRGKDYKSPDGAAPIIADAKAISVASANLLAALERCGAKTRSLIEEMLVDGKLDDHMWAVTDLYRTSDSIVDALNLANGKPRNTKGRPSKKVGDPGLPVGDLFAFNSFLYVKLSGGWLSINETTGPNGGKGSAASFFDVCRPLLPRDFKLQTDAYRLRDLRAQAQALGKSDQDDKQG